MIPRMRLRCVNWSLRTDRASLGYTVKMNRSLTSLDRSIRLLAEWMCGLSININVSVGPRKQDLPLRRSNLILSDLHPAGLMLNWKDSAEKNCIIFSRSFIKVLSASVLVCDTHDDGSFHSSSHRPTDNGIAASLAQSRYNDIVPHSFKYDPAMLAMRASPLTRERLLEERNECLLVCCRYYPQPVEPPHWLRAES
jgi:hypothetical protein